MRRLNLLCILLVLSFNVEAQYVSKFYQNIVSENIYDEIVAEISGEKTINSIYDMASYELSNRNFDELKESKYVIDKLTEYGLSGVKLNRYKGAKAWRAKRGVLHEVSPLKRKIADFTDIPAQLCNGSVDTKIDSAQLVWVGDATDKEIRNVDLTGKIAFTSSAVYRVHDKCIKAGALGVVSYCSSRQLEDPLQIPNVGLYVEKPTFGFQVTPRDGHPLRDRLIRGEKIMVSCDIDSDVISFDFQSPTCVIEGTDPSKGEIVFSAHLFEGYYKLGANDNASGSAVLLEIARAVNTLIESGRIERPLRSLRFIWGDEFNGIVPWVNSERSIMDRTLFDINLDMVGLALGDGKSKYCLHRTTTAFSHYSNDLSEAMMEYMHITNQKSIMVGDFVKPVIAPSGSDDPFVYSVTPFYGASDHSVFSDWGVQIPGTMMITWPDNQYHTSRDRVEFLDQTQLKRAAVISSTIAYLAAIATKKEALSIVGLVRSGSLKRMSVVLTNGLYEVSNFSDEKHVKKALNNLEALYIGEKLALESVLELAPESPMLQKYINESISSVASQIDISKNSILACHSAKNDGREYTIKLTPTEKKAAATYPCTTALVREKGYNAMGQWYDSLTTEEQKEFRTLNIFGHTELAALTLHEGMSLLDIKKAGDYQNNNESSLDDMFKFFKMLEKSGFITMK